MRRYVLLLTMYSLSPSFLHIAMYRFQFPSRFFDALKIFRGEGTNEDPPPRNVIYNILFLYNNCVTDQLENNFSIYSNIRKFIMPSALSSYLAIAMHFIIRL